MQGLASTIGVRAGSSDAQDNHAKHQRGSSEVSPTQPAQSPTDGQHAVAAHDAERDHPNAGHAENQPFNFEMSPQSGTQTPTQDIELDSIGRYRHAARQQQSAGCQNAAKPPGSGNQSSHAAVEPQKPQGVDDRVPAAVALENPNDSKGSAEKHHPEALTQRDAQPKAQQQHELEQPQTVRPSGQKQEKKSATPVFVPIVVSMDDRDHKLLVDEWYSRQMVRPAMLNN